MLFVAFGLLVGPQVLGGIDLASSGSTVRVLAEATLALVLFTDAARIDLGTLRRTFDVPVRLLGVGLALTILLGAVAAAAVFGELSVEEALILGVVLAPTDAALGQAVVTEPRVPARIRQGLNVESGLNDGICVPLLFAAVAVADVESEISGGRGAGDAAARGDRLRRAGRGRGRPAHRGDHDPRDPARLHRGRLGAGHPADRRRPRVRNCRRAARLRLHRRFVAGIVFRLVLGRDPERDNRLAEEAGDVLNGVTFVLFGAVLLGPALSELSWQIALYAVLSLTVVRMIPVALAMLGSHARSPTVGFLGWFGPRGLASIVFAVIVVDESRLPHEHVIVLAIYITVGLSVLAHGLTAAPLAARSARWYERHPPAHHDMESADAEVTRPRRAAAAAAASRRTQAATSRHV